MCVFAFWHWLIDDVIKWKQFPRYWPFVRGIHRWSVNSPHKGQWRGALMFLFYLRPYKRPSKQSWSWWFETPSCPLWPHCNGVGVYRYSLLDIHRMVLLWFKSIWLPIYIRITTLALGKSYASPTPVQMKQGWRIWVNLSHNFSVWSSPFTPCCAASSSVFDKDSILCEALVGLSLLPIYKFHLFGIVLGTLPNKLQYFVSLTVHILVPRQYLLSGMI